MPLNAKKGTELRKILRKEARGAGRWVPLGKKGRNSEDSKKYDDGQQAETRNSMHFISKIPGSKEGLLWCHSSCHLKQYLCRTVGALLNKNGRNSEDTVVTKEARRVGCWASPRRLVQVNTAGGGGNPDERSRILSCSAEMEENRKQRTRQLASTTTTISPMQVIQLHFWS